MITEIALTRGVTRERDRAGFIETMP